MHHGEARDTAPVEPNVLVCEDDADLRRLLIRGLAAHGLRGEAVGSGGALLERLVVGVPPAVLVIDIGLPDADGRDVCQALRARGHTQPVLFLTARDALPDRLAGFRSGGDDYVTKPFALVEVAERLHALLRRAGHDPATSASGLRLDPARHVVHAAGEEVALTPTEFRLLGVLLQHHGEVVRRRTLVDAGWPHGAIVHDNTLDAYAARLRRKLRGLPDTPDLVTLRGVGYRLG
jgi:two-component system, OmpR family, response regulator